MPWQDGAGLGGIQLEALDANLALADEPPLEPNLAAETRADGSFEIRAADPRDAIEVRSEKFGLIADRRILQADQSIEALLVVAPTARVAGRIVGGNGDELVSFHAVHLLPEQARKSAAEIEVEFTRTLRARADGSFDFGRLPCSDTTWLEVNDTQGKPRRVEASASGTLQALIDLH